jgi:hypothetical protein
LLIPAPYRSGTDSALGKAFKAFPFPSPYEIRNAQSQQAPDDLSAGDGLCKGELIWIESPPNPQ